MAWRCRSPAHRLAVRKNWSSSIQASRRAFASLIVERRDDGADGIIDRDFSRTYFGAGEEHVDVTTTRDGTRVHRFDDDGDLVNESISNVSGFFREVSYTYVDDCGPVYGVVLMPP